MQARSSVALPSRREVPQRARARAQTTLITGDRAARGRLRAGDRWCRATAPTRHPPQTRTEPQPNRRLPARTPENSPLVISVTLSRTHARTHAHTHSLLPFIPHTKHNGRRCALRRAMPRHKKLESRFRSRRPRGPRRRAVRARLRGERPRRPPSETQPIRPAQAPGSLELVAPRFVDSLGREGGFMDNALDFSPGTLRVIFGLCVWPQVFACSFDRISQGKVQASRGHARSPPSHAAIAPHEVRGFQSTCALRHTTDARAYTYLSACRQHSSSLPLELVLDSCWPPVPRTRRQVTFKKI